MRGGDAARGIDYASDLGGRRTEGDEAGGVATEAIDLKNLQVCPFSLGRGALHLRQVGGTVASDKRNIGSTFEQGCQAFRRIIDDDNERNLGFAGDEFPIGVEQAGRDGWGTLEYKEALRGAQWMHA